MNFGPHAAYIWACYGMVALAIGLLVAWLLIEGRRHARSLAEIEERTLRQQSPQSDDGSRHPGWQV